MDITELEVFANTARLCSLLADGTVMTPTFESFVIIAGLNEVPSLRTCAFITSLQFFVKVTGFKVFVKVAGLQFVVKIPKLQLIKVTGFKVFVKITSIQIIDNVASADPRFGFSAQ